jgi:hypothetical protein
MSLDPACCRLWTLPIPAYAAAVGFFHARSLAPPSAVLFHSARRADKVSPARSVREK